MSTVKFSQIPVGYTSLEKVLLTGIEQKIDSSDEVSYDNINVSATDLIEEIGRSHITDTYNSSEHDKALSSYGLANNFLTSNFNNTDTTHAISAKALDFIDKTETSFSVIIQDNSEGTYKFNISRDETEEGDKVTKLSVTDGTLTLSEVDLEDLTILANYGFVSEVATELNSQVSSFIDDKVNHILQSSVKYIELTETTECKNNCYYIASTDNPVIYKQNTFNFSNVTFGNNALSISKMYLFFVITKNVSVIFPDNLKWIGTDAPDASPSFVTGNRYLLEIINDGYGIIGKVLYETPIS